VQSPKDEESKKSATAEAASAKKETDNAEAEVKTVRQKLEPSRIALAEARGDVLQACDTVLRIAKQDEENLTVALKAKRADLDVVKSEFDLTVHKGDSRENLDRLEKIQERINAIEFGKDNTVESLDLQVQAAKQHRLNLQNTLAKINVKQEAAKKTYDDFQGTLTQLEKARDERSVNFWKRALALPIIDAFGRPLKIEQIWLPQLTLNNNFKDVARFDRCTTCHQAIDRTAPGSAVTPGYNTRENIMVELATPAEPPVAPKDLDNNKDARTRYL